MPEIVELTKPSADSIIAALEDLLKQAKDGQVTALAYVGIRPNRNTTMNVVWEPGTSAPLLLGGTVFLQNRVMLELLGSE